jgi:hypothetical protein
MWKIIEQNKVHRHLLISFRNFEFTLRLNEKCKRRIHQIRECTAVPVEKRIDSLRFRIIRIDFTGSTLSFIFWKNRVHNVAEKKRSKEFKNLVDIDHNQPRKWIVLISDSLLESVNKMKVKDKESESE